VGEGLILAAVKPSDAQPWPSTTSEDESVVLTLAGVMFALQGALELSAEVRIVFRS
jgi:hypothetical protein